MTSPRPGGKVCTGGPLLAKATARASERVDRALAHRDRLHQVLVRFEKVLASPTGAGRWADVVVSSLRELSDRFDEHVELTEEEGGLFEEILEEAPRLAHRIDGLRAEHVEIATALAGALDRLQAWTGPHAAPFREELTKLLGRLVRHRQKGADLLYEALEVDLGGLD